MGKDDISAKELQEAINDSCASLLAYSICQDSWRFALQKEREKAKMWTSIGIVVLLFFIAAFLLSVSNLCKFLHWFSFTILAVVGIAMIAYYIYSFKTMGKWFKYNAEMLKQLSKPEINLIKCSSETKELMANFINQCRYDKWMERKKETTCGFIQKIMRLMPFSIP